MNSKKSIKSNIIDAVRHKRATERMLKNKNLQTKIRSQNRTNTFFKNRGLELDVGHDIEIPNALQTRKQKLEEFRLSQKKKKEEELKKKKPPFVVSRVTHKLNSPYSYEPFKLKGSKSTFQPRLPRMSSRINNNKITIPHTPGVLRKTEHKNSRNLNKIFSFESKNISNTKPSTSASSTKSMSRQTSKVEPTTVFQFKSKNISNNKPSVSTKIMPKQSIKVETPPAETSPYNPFKALNMSLFSIGTTSFNENEANCSIEMPEVFPGTDSSTSNEENEANVSIEIPEVFTKRKSSKSSIRDKRKTELFSSTVIDNNLESEEYFGPEFHRKRLNQERQILQKYCYIWHEKLDTNKDIPTDIKDEIDSVVGQTKLLTTDKFEQMTRLITQFENQDINSNGPLLLDNDLESFWKVIHIQVEQLYKKFEKLLKLESDNWVDLEKEEEEKKKENDTKLRIKKTKNTKKANKNVKSKMADFIKNQREAQRGNDNKENNASDDTKVFDGGYFHIQSPIRQKTREISQTPIKEDVRRTRFSSRSMIGVSPLVKSLAATSLVEIISTPDNVSNKSILKKEDSANKKCQISTKKIGFTIPEDNNPFETPRSPKLRRSTRIRKTPARLIFNEFHSPSEESTPLNIKARHSGKENAWCDFCFLSEKKTKSTPKMSMESCSTGKKKSVKQSNSKRNILRPSRLNVTEIL